MTAHVLCVECKPTPDHYLCGTPRSQNEAMYAMASPTEPDSPCPVCFSDAKVFCNTCGKHLNIRVGGIAMAQHDRPRRERRRPWWRRMIGAQG